MKRDNIIISPKTYISLNNLKGGLTTVFDFIRSLMNLQIDINNNDALYTDNYTQINICESSRPALSKCYHNYLYLKALIMVDYQKLDPEVNQLTISFDYKNCEKSFNIILFINVVSILISHLFDESSFDNNLAEYNTRLVELFIDFEEQMFMLSKTMGVNKDQIILEINSLLSKDCQYVINNIKLEK